MLLAVSPRGATHLSSSVVTKVEHVGRGAVNHVEPPSMGGSSMILEPRCKVQTPKVSEASAWEKHGNEVSANLGLSQGHPSHDASWCGAVEG